MHFLTWSRCPVLYSSDASKGISLPIQCNVILLSDILTQFIYPLSPPPPPLSQKNPDNFSSYDLYFSNSMLSSFVKKNIKLIIDWFFKINLDMNYIYLHHCFYKVVIFLVPMFSAIETIMSVGRDAPLRLSLCFMYIDYQLSWMSLKDAFYVLFI